MIITAVVLIITAQDHIYRIYLNKSRAHINAWARLNIGVQHSKVHVNKRLYNIQKGLI